MGQGCSAGTVTGPDQEDRLAAGVGDPGDAGAGRLGRGDVMLAGGVHGEGGSVVHRGRGSRGDACCTERGNEDDSGGQRGGAGDGGQDDLAFAGSAPHV